MSPVLDGINYTAYGGYADLDFASLVTLYGGGYQANLAGDHNTGGYRLGKIGQRSVLVDPSGKVWIGRGEWLISRNNTAAVGPNSQQGGPTQQTGRSVFSVTQAKYAPNVFPNWHAAQITRLRDTWHYNAGQYSDIDDDGLPREEFKNGGLYSMRQDASGNVNGSVVKNLVQCVNQTIGHAWLQKIYPDVFDPKFAAFVQHTVVWGGLTSANKTRRLFCVNDDGDFVQAVLGGGHTNEGCGTFANEWTVHGAMVALCAAPTVTTTKPGTSLPFTDDAGQTHNFTSDPTVYTKAAIIAFLKTRYATIGDLNTAWGTGAYYTSFDSDGGWGVGSGLADEDGLRPRTWFGSTSPQYSYHTAGTSNFVDSTTWGLAGQTTTSSYGGNGGDAPVTVSRLKEDLDVFLQLMVEEYLRPLSQIIHSRWVGSLFAGANRTLGKATMNSRPPVIKAHALWCDLLYMDLPNNAWLRRTYAAAGRAIPIIAGAYLPEGTDSCLYYLGGAAGDWYGSTQAARGLAYKTVLVEPFHRQQYPAGDFPTIGVWHWGMYDQPEEGTGWGVCSVNDNAYDGRDYRTVQADPINPAYLVTPEDRVYGDFISHVIAVHKGVLDTLRQTLGEIPPWAPAITPSNFSAGATVVTGTGIIAATIAVLVNGSNAGTGVVDSSGAWSVTIGALSLGDAVTATQRVGGGTPSPASPTVYCTINLYRSFSENFQAPDGNLLVKAAGGVAGTQQAWNQIVPGKLRCISGLVIGTDTTVGHAQLAEDLNLDDMAVSARVRLSTPSGGSIAWALYVRLAYSGTAITNAYRFQYTLTTGNVCTPTISKIVNGVATVLFTGLPFTGPPTFNAVGTFRVKGDTLTFSLAGVDLYTVAGGSAVATGTRGGFMLQQNPDSTGRAQLDDFLLESIPDTPAAPVITGTYVSGATTIAGTGTPGHVVTLIADGAPVGTGVVLGDNSWSVATSPLTLNTVLWATQSNGTASPPSDTVLVGGPTPLFAGGLVGALAAL